MKKTIIAILLLGTYASFAQVKKNNMFLSGSLSTYPSKQTSSLSTYKTNNFQISPRYGYFVNDNAAVGLGIGYSYGYTNQDQPQAPFPSFYKSSNWLLSFSPFYRRYFSMSEKFFLFVQGGLQAGFGEQNNSQSYYMNGSDYTIQSSGSNIFRIGADISSGFTFFPKERWGIEATLANIGYSYNTQKPFAGTEKTTSHNFTLGFYSSFSLGLAYYINH